MTKREIVKLVFEGKKPPYVPWSFGFTEPAREKLGMHYGEAELSQALDDHIVTVGDASAAFEEIGNDCVRDGFGVVWDRSIDKDIGNVKGTVLDRPTLRGYEFPDPVSPRFFQNVPRALEGWRDSFRVYAIGFSLYERAWTLRGMENLMMDFVEHPDFVRELFGRISEWNVAHAREALKYDIDCVYFGDDWGQQRGLQMGPRIWREFIKPALVPMYRTVREAGRYVMIHSCGDVDELFDDLVDIGLNCFNPFQPEVMDVDALIQQYRGRLTFFGGLSTQRTLPYGTPDDVRLATRHLLQVGGDGGYIFAPAHAVPKDVPLENMLAFIETAQGQLGYQALQR